MTAPFDERNGSRLDAVLQRMSYMENRLMLAKLSTGDVAYLYDKSIVLFFAGRRKVLSTSVYNGGYHEDFTAVYNRDMSRGIGMPCEMLAPTYEEHMRIVSRQLGLDAERVTGVGTAAQMKNAAVKSLSYEELTVTAIVTGGIETNGGRVGDPATYFKKCEKPRPGTINIILVLDTDMPPGVLARALVTCTEAKTAAIQELMAGSRYSTGLATGSGTDQTIVVANGESPLYLDGAGKHSKLGELIGRVVMAAVKEALDKQTGLCPAKQHHLLRRLQRFGVTSDTVWGAYQKIAGGKATIKPVFLAALEALAASPAVVPYGVLYIHLLDEYLWQLLSPEETLRAAGQILRLLPEAAVAAASDLDGPPDQVMIPALETWLAAACAKRIAEEGEEA